MSVFEDHAHKFLERGISVVPIAPASKRPGQWSEADGWRGMGDWTRFAKRLPSEVEMEHWCRWPDAGIGVVLGELSNIVALDRDYDVPGASDALDQLIPFSPVGKRGEKGWTKFYRFNGERSCSFDVQGHRVLDVLADGRQTVVPPTAHPSGCSYVWITLDTLDNITGALDLPQLPADFLQQVEKLLAPYQTDGDKKYQRKKIAPAEDADPINTAPSIQQQYFRDINQTALNNLDQWVKTLIPTARPDGEGYRAIATWRMVTNHNVGINPKGICDFGGGYGMTPLDLVMRANGLPFSKAVEHLRTCLNMNEPEPIVFGGSAKPTATSPQQPAAVKPLPWQKATPAPVILPPSTSEAPARAIPQFVTDPPGILGEIVRWINATAPKQQPELATIAAIVLASAATQRIYKSNFANFTSLYGVMIAKSTEGKEHPQSCVERALTAAGLGKLLTGSGYTSSGAVFSALLKSPSHVAVIDEMGKLLKLSRAKGNSNSEAAIDKLVEAFGKLNGVIRPPVYSTMTLPKAQGLQPGDKVIFNPAISLLGATTPDTFYGALTDDLVKDGFLGRLLVAESTQPRQQARFTDQTDPPPRIVDWLKAVNGPAQRQGNLAEIDNPELAAVTVAMSFTQDCIDVLRAFEAELNGLKDAFETDGLDVLLGRTYEKSMRLAMIAALATDPDVREIQVGHVQWAIEFVRHHDMQLVRNVRRCRIRNQTDEETKRAINYIRGAKSLLSDQKNANYAAVLAAGGMPHALLLKRMHMKSREFGELMNTATEAGFITKCLGHPWNYAGEVYFAVED
jgi:Bifunctional DNA primase/polymerase, N-terminal/Protein of unknown function (DUF3987)